MTNTTRTDVNAMISLPQVHIDITYALEQYTLDEVLQAIAHDHDDWRFNRTEKSVWDENGVIAVFDIDTTANKHIKYADAQLRAWGVQLKNAYGFDKAFEVLNATYETHVLTNKEANVVFSGILSKEN